MYYYIQRRQNRYGYSQVGGAEPYQNWSGDSSEVILLQSDVTINDYVAPLIETWHGRQVDISWEHHTRYLHAQLLLVLRYLHRSALFDN